MFLQQFGQQLGVLHQDASPTLLCCLHPQVGHQLRLLKELCHIGPSFAELLTGHLHGRAELEGSRRTDVMAHAGSTGTHGHALFIPIGVDKGKWGITALVHQELPQLPDLLFGKGHLGVRMGTHRTVDVVPQIGCTLAGHPLNVLTADHLVEVGLVDASCHAKDKPRFPTGLQSAQAAHERGHMAQPSQLLSHVVVQQQPVGEQLEVAVLMTPQHLHQPLVEQRLTTQDAKEPAALGLGGADDAVQLLRREHLLSSGTHPTAIAGEVARLVDADHHKGREELLPLPRCPLKVAHILPTAETEVPGKLPQQSHGGLSGDSAAYAGQ